MELESSPDIVETSSPSSELEILQILDTNFADFKFFKTKITNKYIVSKPFQNKKSLIQKNSPVKLLYQSNVKVFLKSKYLTTANLSNEQWNIIRNENDPLKNSFLWNQFNNKTLIYKNLNIKSFLKEYLLKILNNFFLFELKLFFIVAKNCFFFIFYFWFRSHECLTIVKIPEHVDDSIDILTGKTMEMNRFTPVYIKFNTKNPLILV